MVSLKVILTVIGIAAAIFTFFYSGDLTAVIIIAFGLMIVLAFIGRSKSEESGKDVEKGISNTINREKKQEEKEEKDEKTEEANEAANNAEIEKAKQLKVLEQQATNTLAEDLKKNNYVVTNENLPQFLKEIQYLGSVINAQYQWVAPEIKKLENANSAMMAQLADLQLDKKELQEAQGFVSNIVGDLKPALSSKLAEMAEAINAIDSILKQKLQIIPLQTKELTTFKGNSLKGLQFLKEVDRLLKEGKGGEAKAFLDSAQNAQYESNLNFAKFQELQGQLMQLSLNINQVYVTRKKISIEFDEIYKSYVVKQAEAAQKNAA